MPRLSIKDNDRFIVETNLMRMITVTLPKVKYINGS